MKREKRSQPTNQNYVKSRTSEIYIFYAGYPRNAIFYHLDKVAEGKNRIINELKRIAPNDDFSGVKIISYMPTFRNDSSHLFSFESLKNNRRMVQYLSDNNVIIIQAVRNEGVGEIPAPSYFCSHCYIDPPFYCRKPRTVKGGFLCHYLPDYTGFQAEIFW